MLGRWAWHHSYSTLLWRRTDKKRQFRCRHRFDGGLWGDTTSSTVARPGAAMFTLCTTNCGNRLVTTCWDTWYIIQALGVREEQLSGLQRSQLQRPEVQRCLLVSAHDPQTKWREQENKKTKKQKHGMVMIKAINTYMSFNIDTENKKN